MSSLLIVVVVSILFSALFSGMEIAFLSANRLKLEIEKKQSRAFAFVANLFSKRPGQFITTILVGNNIALVVYSLQMSRLIQSMLGCAEQPSSSSFLIETVLSAVVIIFTAEFIPKAMVRLNPNFYYRLFAIPVYLFYLILYPISLLVTSISTLILRMLGLPMGDNRGLKSFDRVDLALLLDEAVESEGELSADKDIRLIQNALDFSDILVRDCMVPRVEIEAIDKSSSIEELSERFVSTHFSRLLVYEGSIDQIIGYVNTKSLFARPNSIEEILTQVDYVPESMSAQRLLTSFIKKRHSITVVIDEFGGTAGMVTIEDILEEIFGEIEDEHDAPDLVEKRMGDKEFILSGRLEVEYLNQKYPLGIEESDDYDTLAGYVIDCYQGIPQNGEVIHAKGMKIKVLRAESSRLELLRITLL